MIRTSSVVPLILLLAQSLPAQTPEQKKATIKYLRELQTPDGGFQPQVVDARLDQPLKGSLRATTSALRALKYFGGTANDKSAAAKFVQKCFDPATGGFADQPGGTPDVFSTAVGLMAVVETGLKMEDYRDKAVQYLGDNAKEFEEIRMAAAGMEAAGTQAPSAKRWRQELAEKINADGSFGAGAGKARATGSTVVALLRLGSSDFPKDRTIAILNQGENADGGFGKDDASGSDLETSYRVVRCYHMLKAKPAKAEALREFIARCRNTDGGYGVAPGKPSLVSGVYFAGIILHWLVEK